MNDSKIKILYVDDEPINLLLFQKMFENNLCITTSKSGPDALNLLENGLCIDLIISDMKMPFMNGLEFLAKAKEIVGDIPSIILSGYQQSECIEKALKSGLIIEYLTKPLNKSKLDAIISDLHIRM